MFEPLALSELATYLSAELHGEDVQFDRVETDTRRPMPGALFIALRGERFDGHHYLAQAAQAGAVAALVDQVDESISLPQIKVNDTRLALGLLGGLNRSRFDGPLIAITGSSGKTSVKEMIASILRAAKGKDDAVLATQGNLNNDLGVPLTLLRLNAEHQAAVIELGASRAGEIAYTVSLAKPHVSVLNNAGTAHVGEFGSPEKIVQAKGEIIDGLADDGTAILNRDDAAYSKWARRTGSRRILSFGMENPLADFYPGSIAYDLRGCPSFMVFGPECSLRVQLTLPGRHNIAEARPAVAATWAIGVDEDSIAEGLRALQPVKGRLVAQVAPNGVRVIDDTYNANPASMKAAIDVLTGFTGRRVLVLGDMGELGEWAQSAHSDIGEYARDKVDVLLATGPLMQHAVDAFGAGGHHLADQAGLIELLRQEAGNGTTILVKGSRSAAMENIVAALCPTSENH